MLRGLLFWSLLPFVCVQALRVRRNASRLAPAGGPSLGRCGSGPPFRLLGIGDSIVAGVGASTLERALVGRTAEALAASTGCTIEWQAIGRSGIDSGGMLAELLGELPSAPVDAFVVSVGVNDVTSLSRLSTWRRNLAALLQALATHSPAAVIAFAGMPPLHEFPLLPQPLRALIGFRGESLDRISRCVIAAHALARHVPIVLQTQGERFCADGFHPSEASYVEFGRVMARQIHRQLAAGKTG